MTIMELHLPIYRTPESPCGYLPTEVSANDFIDPQIPMDSGRYEMLIERGFRRSGKYIYRPACAECQACLPMRVLVDEFVPSRSQRRIINKNKDLEVISKPAEDTDYRFELYQRYLKARHDDGEMDPNDRHGFNQFLGPSWCTGTLLEFYLDGALICVAVVDEMPNSLSAVYTYFAPEHEKRSLGTLSVLLQIQLAKKMQKPHLYLGYWIKECSKMSYKNKYGPAEIFTNQQWTRLKAD